MFYPTDGSVVKLKVNLSFAWNIGYSLERILESLFPLTTKFWLNQLIKLIFLITSFPHKLSALEKISSGLLFLLVNLSFCALYWHVILKPSPLIFSQPLCSQKSPGTSFQCFHVRKKSNFLLSKAWHLCPPVYFAIRIFVFCLNDCSCCCTLFYPLMSVQQKTCKE